MKSLFPIVALLIFACLPASAETYQHIDRFGNRTYSNVAPKGLIEAPPSARFERLQKNSAVATPTPASFPWISMEEQQTRDVMRQRILIDELRSQERLLVTAEAKGDAVTAAFLRDNVASLEKELKGLR